MEFTIKGAQAHTHGQLPKKGQKAPPIVAVNTDFQEKSLGDFKGKKKIICFVPSLDTPVCSLSAQKFGEAVKKMGGVAVIYISTDLPFAQKRACHVEGVTTLSLVRSKKTAEDYGVLITDSPLQGLCARAVVVIDEKDHVIYSELVKELTTEPDYKGALHSLETTS